MLWAKSYMYHALRATGTDILPRAEGFRRTGKQGLLPWTKTKTPQFPGRAAGKKYKRPRHISLPVPPPVNSKIYWRKDRMSIQRHNSHPLVTVATVLATPQMYQHACSPARLGALPSHHCTLLHSPGTLPIPTNYETNYMTPP